MTLTIKTVTFADYEIELDKAVQKAVFDNKPRVCWHVRAENESGLIGWGDIAPWPGFSDPATNVERQLDSIEGQLKNIQLSGLADMGEWLDGLSVSPVIRFGLELAILDLFAQAEGVPIAALLNSSYSRRISVHALVDTASNAQRSVRSGANAVKVKLSDSWDRDLARLNAIRRAVPDTLVRVDANGAWSKNMAEERIRELSDIGVDIIEQPVRASDLASLQQLASTCTITMSADESVCIDPKGVLEIGELNELVLKPMYLGGIIPAFNIASEAHKRGFKLCITHALESEIGRTGAAHLAMASDALQPGVHGLSGAWGCEQSQITIPHEPGLGARIK